MRPAATTAALKSVWERYPRLRKVLLVAAVIPLLMLLTGSVSYAAEGEADGADSPGGFGQGDAFTGSAGDDADSSGSGDSSGGGTAPSALEWMNVEDTRGISIWKLELSLDRGGVTSPGKLIWSVLTEFLWQFYRAFVAVAIWIIDWVLSFDWLDTGKALEQTLLSVLGYAPRPVSAATSFRLRSSGPAAPPRVTEDQHSSVA